MNKYVSIIDNNEIQSRIFTVRGLQVMLDSDLATLYGVENKRLNEQVKRNIERFPVSFRFQLTKDEFEAHREYLRSQDATLNDRENMRSQFATACAESLKSQNVTLKDVQNLKSQFATSSSHGGRRTLPYVFTEQGVSMLSAVLKSETAIKVSIQIMGAFVGMRKFITGNAAIFQRLDNVEQKQYITDTKLDKVFAALEAGDIKPKQGIFFDGQVFDAYLFIADLIKSAKTSIVLIDNYVDETVLTLLSKRAANCTATIYTKTITKKLKLDLKKHNGQYSPITIKTFNNAHDRFLLLDDKEIYHIGASLKDLGKKWFAFSKFYKGALDVLGRLGDE
ncbi:MAG: ORF6N domain-containing protein [Deltaproteobacteria bacterium]|nr:ORF6N domain-containing protein [Candidatus Tharpella aukensis]